jgi:hypothetical protein
MMFCQLAQLSRCAKSAMALVARKGSVSKAKSSHEGIRQRSFSEKDSRPALFPDNAWEARPFMGRSLRFRLLIDHRARDQFWGPPVMPDPNSNDYFVCLSEPHTRRRRFISEGFFRTHARRRGDRYALPCRTPHYLTLVLGLGTVAAAAEIGAVAFPCDGKYLSFNRINGSSI